MSENQPHSDRYVPEPTQKTSNVLWLIVVIGLFALIFGAFTLAFVLVVDGNTDTDPGPFFTLGTASLTGLLGLFVSPPTIGKGAKVE